MKKIAVITNGPHFCLGGVENYSKIFYEHFGFKYQITEFPTLNIKKNMHPNMQPNPQISISYALLGWKPHSIVWGGSYTQKNYKNIFENYDLVIINAIFLPAKWICHPRAIVVQHMDKDWYRMSYKNLLISLGKMFNRLLFNVSTITNAFRHAYNVVFFDETTATESKKNRWYVPLAHKDNNDLIAINQNKRDGFVWINRLDNYQKNVKAIVKIANDNPDVKIFGKGHGERIINKYLQRKIQFCGHLPHDLVDKYLKNSKALLITSNYEGFSYATVEALSSGTPIILFDTFSAINFFKKSCAVFPIAKGDFKAFNQKVAWLRNLSGDDYKKISHAALKFSAKYFSKQTFWHQWEGIINQFLNQKLLSSQNFCQQNDGL